MRKHPSHSVQNAKWQPLIEKSNVLLEHQIHWHMDVPPRLQSLWRLVTSTRLPLCHHGCGVQSPGCYQLNLIPAASQLVVVAQILLA